MKWENDIYKSIDKLADETSTRKIVHFTYLPLPSQPRCKWLISQRAPSSTDCCLCRVVLPFSFCYSSLSLTTTPPLPRTMYEWAPPPTLLGLPSGCVASSSEWDLSERVLQIRQIPTRWQGRPFFQCGVCLCVYTCTTQSALNRSRKPLYSLRAPPPISIKETLRRRDEKEDSSNNNKSKKQEYNLHVLTYASARNTLSGYTLLSTYTVSLSIA